MNTVTVHIDTSEIDEVTKKAERLNELLEKASSIINELASRGKITLSFKIED